MSLSYNEFQTADRRLVILRALESAAQYQANTLLLRRFCESVGHAVSLDRLDADVAWLFEQALVTRRTDQGVTVATLTARGQDVAAGRAECPGVARPQPF